MTRPRTRRSPSRGRARTGPGGARTLTPRDPSREPNGQTFWFGADLAPGGIQLWRPSAG